MSIANTVTAYWNPRTYEPLTKKVLLISREESPEVILPVLEVNHFWQCSTLVIPALESWVFAYYCTNLGKERVLGYIYNSLKYETRFIKLWRSDCIVENFKKLVFLISLCLVPCINHLQEWKNWRPLIRWNNRCCKWFFSTILSL